MTLLDLFGLVYVVWMMLCYMLEARGQVWTLLFALGCLSSSAYGFMQGAWPFGIAEAVWAVVAFRRWRFLAAAREPLA